MRTEYLNRAMLTAGGAVLAAAGAAVLAAGLGAFGAPATGQPVINDAGQRLLAANDVWAWAAVAGVGALILLAGALWLLSQLRAERLARVELEPDRGTGHTRLSARALTDALAEDAAEVHGVEGTAAHLVSRRSGRELRLTLRLNLHADVEETRQHLEHAALPHARQVVSPDPLPARVRLDVARRAGERVR